MKPRFTGITSPGGEDQFGTFYAITENGEIWEVRSPWDHEKDKALPMTWTLLTSFEDADETD